VAISGRTAFVYNPETATVRLAGDARLSEGLAYTVTSVLGEYSVRQLSAAGSNRPPDERYLALPDSFPDDLREQAASIVEGKSSSYARAVALQNWFRENFEYDLTVNYGSGTKGMREFLEARRGFCEQFASTFAAFARSVGIPARVAVGFTPGVDDGDAFVVRSRNAHAWPEVWFNRIGWVSFEPTPGRGAPGNEGYTGVRPEQDETVEPDTETDTDSPDGTDAPTTTAAPDGSGSGPAPTLPPDIVSGPDGATGVPSITTPEDSLPPDSESTGSGSAGTWLLVLLILGVLGAAVYVWLRVLPDALRRRRQRLVGDEPADRVLHAWGDTTVLLAVVGAGRRPDETPLEHAERTRSVVSTFGIDHDALEQLAHTATRALYARESIDPARATECLHIAAAVGRALITNAPAKVRVRMWLDPRLASRHR
jgi:transglutaminase-like putative cysteine protease